MCLTCSVLCCCMMAGLCFVTCYFRLLLVPYLPPSIFLTNLHDGKRGLKRQPWEFGHFHRGEIESLAVAPQPVRVHG